MNKVKKFQSLVCIAMLTVMMGCANIEASAAAKTIDVTIEFDSNGCPTSANMNLLSRGAPRDKLLFTSNPLKTGDKYNEFSLTFDPFVGRPYNSNKGVYRSLPLSGKATPSRHNSGQKEFKFKYVINAENCASIDPVVIIDR